MGIMERVVYRVAVTMVRQFRIVTPMCQYHRKILIASMPDSVTNEKENWTPDYQDYPAFSYHRNRSAPAPFSQ